MVTINVKNFLKNGLFDMFAESTSFVDEMVQNSCRAGATELFVNMDDSSMSFMDNGHGCSDMSVILKMCDSAWESDAAKIQNPFGMGFFSLGNVCDHAKATSIGGSVSVDFKKMRSGETDCVSFSEETIDGFLVECTFGERSASQDKVRAAFADACKFSPLTEATFNYFKVPSDVQKNSGEQDHAFNGSFYHGWLSPKSRESDGVIVYYAGRSVGSLEISYVSGVVFLSDSHPLKLRAPDRKAFVKNAEYDCFKSEIERITSEMYVDLAGTEQADEMEYAISWHVDATTLSKKYALQVLQPSDLDEIQRNVVSKTKLVAKEADAIATSCASAVPVEVTVSTPDMSVGIDSSVEKLPLPEKIFIDQVDKEKTVWCDEQFAMSNPYLVRTILDSGFTILIATNYLSRRILNNASISQLSSSTVKQIARKTVKFTSVGYRNNIEMRFCQLMVAMMSGRVDSFRVADFSADNIYAICFGKDVYVSRGWLSTVTKAISYKPDKTFFGKNDVRLCVACMSTVCHETVHAQYGFRDGTIDFHIAFEEMIDVMSMAIAKLGASA